VINRRAFPDTLVERLGLSVSAAQWQRLEKFWSLLLTWNARINLTGARTREELVEEHLPDSLAMARLVPPDARLLDVGSGGGLPALPFAILRPDATVCLVEPRAKRVAFLRTAVRELALTAEVEAQRVEVFSGWRADVAGSRATFAPSEWLERGRALAPRVLAFTSGRTEAGEPAGCTLEDQVEYETASDHRRWLGLFRCT
jgi:16S rRNA (guanine527-N7)-methyltransferase